MTDGENGDGREGTISRRRVLRGLGVGGSVALAGCSGNGGGECDDLHIDLSTGTTNFTPDPYGTPDSDWTVTPPVGGGTGPTVQAVSIEPVASWVTVTSANWIDSEGTGGWPAPNDPRGDYVYEREFEVPENWSEGQCELRIHAWAVDDSATIELERASGTVTLDGTGAPGHETLEGPVTQPVGPGQYTLRARVRNNETINGLLIDADVFCDCATPATDTPCDLSVTKEHTGGVVEYEDTTEFEIEVCNDGDGTCEPGPVTVTDDLPPGVSFVSGSGSGWTCTESGGVVTCEHPHSSGLGPNDCLPTLTLTVDVGSPKHLGESFVNCVTVEQGDTDLSHKRDCAEVSIEPVEPIDDQLCDLEITKSHGGDLVAPGDTTEFEIEVCNVGNLHCTRLVRLVDYLSPHLTLVSVSGSGWTYYTATPPSGTRVFCTHQNGGGLAPGECLPTLTLTVQLGTTYDPGPYVTNTASLSGSFDDEDENPSNNTDSAVFPVDQNPNSGDCDLSITKNHDGGHVTEGSTTAFSVEVCNVGDGDCAGPVTVTDDLPAGLTFDAAAGSGWAVTESSGTVTCTHPNGGGLAPGECLPTLTLSVAVGPLAKTGDRVDNCAVVESADANSANDTDCVTVPVQADEGECDLSIAKRLAGGDVVYAGEAATFEVEVCNVGDGLCEGPVTVTDDLPAGLTFDAATGSEWAVTENGGTVTCTHPNGGGLAPGECLATLTLSVDIGSLDETGDRIRNCARIEGGDPNPDNDRDCVRVPVQTRRRSCDLSITKRHGGDVKPGATTTFEIDVCHEDGGRCTDPVKVVDTLPSGVTFLAASGNGWTVTESNGTVTCTHPNGSVLGPGDCLPTLTLTVQLGSLDETGDRIRNCARIEGSDPNPDNDRDCAVVSVGRPDGG